MATVRPGNRRGSDPAATATPRREQAQGERPRQEENYSWQEAPSPVTRPLTHREQVETTVALCVLVGIFGAVAIGLIALSVVQLDGTDRVVAAALCLVVAGLLATLIGYLVLTPLGLQRPAGQRAASSRASRARP